MTNGWKRPGLDVFETKLHRLNLGKSAIVTETISVLQDGAVHEVVNERMPSDETGRLVAADGALCAFCGTLLSSEAAKAFVCQAAGCGRIACEKHRFIDADGRIICTKHDPWRALLELLWGCDEVEHLETPKEDR